MSHSIMRWLTNWMAIRPAVAEVGPLKHSICSTNFYIKLSKLNCWKEEIHLKWLFDVFVCNGRVTLRLWRIERACNRKKNNLFDWRFELSLVTIASFFSLACILRFLLYFVKDNHLEHNHWFCLTMPDRKSVV